MASQFVGALYPWVSRDRLEAYRPPNGSDLDMAVTYLYSIVLSEALYTPLGVLEVTLRNGVHAALTASYGSPAWYDLRGVLEPNQADDVVRAKRRIAALGKPVNPGRVVADLHFGFWVSLLSSLYDARFWRPDKARLLKRAFPNIPVPLRQRTTIYARYNTLRALRNRVFHHEPIWNRPTLVQDYRTLYEAIEWISPDMAAACRLVDRFPAVLTNGRSSVEAALKQHLGLS